MIKVVAFKKEHVDQLHEQEATRWLVEYLTPEHVRALEQQRNSFTALVNGRVIFCGGVIEFWNGRGELWSIIDGNCKFDFVPLHREVQRFIAALPLRRIEAVVDRAHRNGHRWMRLLGFEVEAEQLKGYFPDGRDATLYALVRK